MRSNISDMSGLHAEVPTMATSNRDVKIPLEKMLVNKIMWSPLL